MSSIEGSCAFEGWVIVFSPRNHLTSNRISERESIAPRDGRVEPVGQANTQITGTRANAGGFQAIFAHFPHFPQGMINLKMA
jgi:hypothetical protein